MASFMLKILMTSGSKKGNQIHFSFLSKVPANEPPPGSPRGTCGEGGPPTGNFAYLSKPHLSGSPVTEPSPMPPPRSLFFQGVV